MTAARLVNAHARDDASGQISGDALAAATAGELRIRRLGALARQLNCSCGTPSEP